MRQKIKGGGSVILKSEWLLIFFVGLVIVGVTLPQIASAYWWEYLIPGWNLYKGAKDAWNVAGSAATDIGSGFLNAILIAVGSIILAITGVLFGIGKELLGAIISGKFFYSYTGMDNPVIKSGWTAARDLANMFIVLGFVVVGIATALRIKEYQAQKTLVPLIIVAILINFSLVICGIAIDVSNLMVTHFLKTGGVLGKALLDTITKQVKALYSSKTLLGNPLNTLAAIAGVALYNIFGFFVLMFYALLFLARYVALWILVALSPLAFVCYVFNFTKPYFNFWLKQFTQWCLVGVFGSFFIYLGDALTSQLLSDTTSRSWGAVLVSATPLNPVLWLPLIFLLVGFMATLQTGAMGANIITNAGKAMVSKVKSTASTALKESRAGQAVGGAFGKTIEALHWQKKGTTAQQKQERGKDALNRAKADYAQNPDKVVSDAGSRRGGIDTEARAMVAAEEGKLILDPSNKQYNPRAVANYRAAATRGYDTKEAEKKDPRLVQYNDRKINETMKTTGITNRADAVREAQRSVVRRQSAGELGSNLTIDAFKDLNTIEDMNLDRHLRHPKFQENISPAKIAAMKQFTTAGTPQSAAIKRRIFYLKATGNPADAAKATDLENKQIEIDSLI